MKPINFDVELKSTSAQRQFTRQKAMTNDLNSVDINYKILDMTDLEMIDKLCEVTTLQSDIIRKQATIIAQNEIVNSMEEERKLVDEILDSVEFNLRHLK